MSLAMAAIIALCILAYLLLVRVLRFRRARGHEKFPTGQSLTFGESWTIVQSLVEYEFPLVFSKATLLALFRTYGIPEISSVLCSTGQFSSSFKTDKRITDTGLLLLEAILNPPGDERSLKAMARIKFLHESYRRAGKITNELMLYTLSLFALQPVRWVEQYDWRQLTNTEEDAIGTLWYHYGLALEIDYSALPIERGDRVDGLRWLRALETWSVDFEVNKMRPSEASRAIAEATLDELMVKVPRIMHLHVTRFVSTLLDERLRSAMGIPNPPTSYTCLASIAITARRQILRHACLPRWRPKQRLPKPIPNTDRFRPRDYRRRPWYMPVTPKGQYGLITSIHNWWTGGVVHDDGDRYFPSGYRFIDLGPEEQVGRGAKAMKTEVDRLARILKQDAVVSV